MCSLFWVEWWGQNQFFFNGFNKYLILFRPLDCIKGRLKTLGQKWTLQSTGRISSFWSLSFWKVFRTFSWWDQPHPRRLLRIINLLKVSCLEMLNISTKCQHSNASSRVWMNNWVLQPSQADTENCSPQVGWRNLKFFVLVDWLVRSLVDWFGLFFVFNASVGFFLIFLTSLLEYNCFTIEC